MSKTRKLSRKALSLLLTLVMALGLIMLPTPQAKAAERVTVAAWNCTTAGAGAVTAFPATSGAAGFAKSEITLQKNSAPSSFTKAVAAAGGVPVGSEASGSSWAAWTQATAELESMYWQIELHTKGFTGVELALHAYGTATSPASWEVKYSTDGTNFTRFDPPVTYASDVTNNAALAIPATIGLGVLDDAEGAVFVGLFATAAATNATGNNRLCNVKVTGIPTGDPIDPGDPDDPDPDDPGDPGVITIAEARGMAVDSIVVVEGAVTRAIQSSATNLTNCTLYIQDATGGVAVYVSGITIDAYNIGTKLRVTGKVGAYTGLVQIQPANLAAIEELPAAPAPVTPEKVTISGLNTLAYEGKLVRIAGVRLSAIATNSNHTITDPLDGASTTLRCTAGTTLPADFAVDDIVDVIGVAANYNGTAQFMVSKFDDISLAAGTTIAQANATPAGEIVTIKGQATYLYANNSMMVQDGTGENDGICVYLSGANFSSYIGKIVTVTGNRTDYAGLKEVVPANINDVVIAEDEAAFITAPKEITVAELAAGKYVGSWVVVKDVQLTSRNTATTAQNHTISQNGATVTLRAALSAAIAEGDWLTITGCGYMFNTPQLFCLESGIVPGKEPEPPDTSGTDGSGIAAQWNLSAASGTAIRATGGDNASDATLQFIKNSDAQTLNFSSGGANLSGLNGVANDAWWYVTMPGAGFKNIEVCWNMRSSATGPRDFKLQYSADGAAWFDADDPAITVPSAVAIGSTHYEKTLPAGANNLPVLHLRWLLTSDIAANGAAIGSGGTHQINYITINGDYILGENQLRRPVSDTESGAVPLGQVITFAPGSEEDADAEGYTIMVSDDDGAAWAAAAGGKYAVSSLPLTLLVKAVAPGKDDSRVSTYAFTQAKLPLVTASKNSGPVIPGATIKLESAVADANIMIIVNGEAAALYTEALTLSEDLFIGDPGRVTITAWAEKDGYITGDSVAFAYTIAVTGGEKVYFGQLHSHTTLSDGSGTVEEAFRYARDVAGLDFFAVTDHSNSLDAVPTGTVDPTAGDNPAGINLDTYKADNANWRRGQDAAAAAYREGEFISFYGYEMTWSGGPGHMNTFNTGGFVSRNNTALNAKPNDAGMRAYYELLTRTPDSITMFNHPGTTFGNFSNFAYYDPIIDQRITLLEVGNGEGTIGSGGYFPSYEQYTMALDKGWHVAPTNDQDNHLGKWGDSNTARVAVWTNDFTLSGIYQALRDMRVYATEVADLEIVYKVNGQPLGTILDVVPSSAEFTAEIANPTAGNYVKSVCLVTNGGVEILKDTPNAQNYDYSKTINNPASGYYYLRVIVSTPQGDRIAVTAPVWLGQGKAAGFSEVTKDKIMPVTGEGVELDSTIFNNEQQPVTLVSIKYEARGAVLSEKSGLGIIIAPNSEYTDKFTYTPSIAGETTVTVTAALLFADGVERTYSYSITYDVWDAEGLVYIGVDGSHYNEYVSGNYKDNMTNFADVAASYGVRVNILNTEAELIAAASNPQYRALLLTAPSRRLYPNIPGNTAGLPSYRSYTPEVRDAVQAFAERGGTTIFTGWSNIYEGGYTDTYGTLAGMPYEDLMFAQQNKLLAAVGSTLRIAQDGAADAVVPYWPGVANAPNRLYPAGVHNAYNFDNPLLTTVDVGQRFSQYGGTTVFAVAPENSEWWSAPAAATLPGSVSKIISLPEDCRSEDYDIVHPNSDAYPRVASTMYDDQFMIMASETVDHGNGVTSQVIVAGGAFMSNFEIRNASVDNISDLYSNQNIVINLIQSIMEVTPIAEVKEKAEGTIVTIEGIATTNVYSGDGATNTGFFDCIYVQDATGGINLFPVSSGVLEGQRIRVTGTVSSYQGEIQIAVRKLDVVDHTINKVKPAQITTSQAMEPDNTGLLAGISGVVSDVKETGGVISQFTITDISGRAALVYINAYITTAVDLSFVRNGVTVSVTGLCSVGENQTSSDPMPRIRVRDRNEIVLIRGPSGWYVAPPVTQTLESDIAEIEVPLAAILPFDDINEDDWFHDSVLFVYEEGIMIGTSADSFEPELALTRAMLVTIFYRLAGNPDINDPMMAPFTDVPQGAWYTDAVLWAAENGIVNGYGNGLFGPNNAVTRQDLAVIVMRYMNFMGIVKPVTQQFIIFADAAEIADYAMDAIQTLNKLGIIKGVDTSENGQIVINPKGAATRAEVAALLYRFLTLENTEE